MLSRGKGSDRSKELLSVPQNFIPGLTKPRLSILPDPDEFQQPSRKVSSICYQGIQVKIRDDPNLPEKLLVQAGLLALSLPAPSRHFNCTEKASHFSIKSYGKKNFFHRFHKPNSALDHIVLDRRSTMPTLTDTGLNRKKPVGRTRSESLECVKCSDEAVTETSVQYTLENLSPTRSNSLPDIDDNLLLNDTEHCLSKEISVAVPSAAKRRSRSFSSGLNYPPELITQKVKRKIGLAVTDNFKNVNEQVEKETLDAVQKTLRAKLPKTFRVTASIGLCHPIASKSVQQDNQKHPLVSSPNLLGHPNDESNKKWNFKKLIQKGSPKLIRQFKSFDENANSDNKDGKSPTERRRSNVTENVTACERPSSPFTRAKTYSKRIGESKQTKYHWNSFDYSESRTENRNSNGENIKLFNDNNKHPLKSTCSLKPVHSTAFSYVTVTDRKDDTETKSNSWKQESFEQDNTNFGQVSDVANNYPSDRLSSQSLGGNHNKDFLDDAKEGRNGNKEENTKELEEEISRHLNEINEMFNLD